ncbi:class I SAM-dependent methyltransferase [Mesorhizobium sp. CA14]|uniref:class I SAM-dependent methyltransferase n=1 Tax=Mesorhizobium sp. CA14 TaxID=2876642 RepID=UPI001CCC1CF0|nr:class I SAM-dependent methyltransferase [Mesorhizobium sp. CA14]MBZ9849650.1 class I SAM-dependent methyltransferase [Mesorhizobium sp. CA14]
MRSFSSDVDPAKSLPAGSPDHYTAFVGPPDQYDFMGATQFRLLCALGLREDHTLLDFGCGSLRAGRLFIPYLQQGGYFGIDPNKWLIDEAIKSEVGEWLIGIKRCRFDYNKNFDSSVFGMKFDFIIAQSIFSHAGREQVVRAFDGFSENIKDDGIIAATFVVSGDKESEHVGDEWVYPACVSYSQDTIANFASKCSLKYIKIPWYHPRQSWFLFSRDSKNLPDAETAASYLQGRVLKNQPIA